MSMKSMKTTKYKRIYKYYLVDVLPVLQIYASSKKVKSNNNFAMTKLRFKNKLNLILRSIV
jgi:hypothetical protein